MRQLTFNVTEAYDGQTLKRFLREQAGVSSSALKHAKQLDHLFVNGISVHADKILRAGDRAAIFMEESTHRSIQAEPGEIRFAYMDEDIYIVDKPAPLPCQATPKQPYGTLENRLAGFFQDEPDFIFRPVNRLDKGTSGLMSCARNAHSCQRLQRTLHTENFIREYVAVVEGAMQGIGSITLPLAKAPAATVRRCVDYTFGSSAVTHYRTIQTGKFRSMVRLRLETGRTHQIRVHLSSIGFPIVGDFLYGSEAPELPGRFALHSVYLSLEHPVTGKNIEATSAIPPVFWKLLEE